MDLHEDKEKNLVTATFEFPGAKKEDVQVDVHNGRLTVAAETKLSDDREQDGYAVRERSFGKYSRTLQLPKGVKVGGQFLLSSWSVDCVLTFNIGRGNQSLNGEWCLDSHLPKG